MDYIKTFSGLAKLISDDLVQAGGHLHLAAISTKHLRAFMQASEFDGTDFLAWCVSADSLPYQGWDFDFGEPAITVARNDDLRIDLLFWLQKAAPIHDHVTCGSFGALMGDRLHSRYHFVPESTDEADPDVAAGELTVTDFGLMREGQAEEIRPELIHDIYWIDTPSITIVVRCNEHPGVNRRPADYFLPGIRVVDPMRLSDTLTKRRLEALELLALADQSAYVEALSRVLSTGTPQEQVGVFASAAVEYGPQLDQALSTVGENPLLARLTAGRESMLQRSIYGGTYAGDNDAAQLLLALLWANANREEIIQVFKERVEGDDTLVDIAKAFADVSEMDSELEHLMVSAKQRLGL